MAQQPEQIASKLKQIRGEANKQWGRITNQELVKIRRRRAALVEKIQNKPDQPEGSDSPAE